MPRPYRPADFRTIRRLHDAAGSREELNRWIDTALKQRKREADRMQSKETVGTITDLLESKGAARSALIRQLVRENPDIRGVGTERSAHQRMESCFQRADNFNSRHALNRKGYGGKQSPGTGYPSLSGWHRRHRS